MNKTEFWKTRAKEYNSLKWVQDKKYLDLIFKEANPKLTDVLLDVGCGTGKIANHFYSAVRSVIGLDISVDMSKKTSIPILEGSILYPSEHFKPNSFDIITARMVFHHLTDNPYDLQIAINNCYYLLKDGGRLVIAESVPPSGECEVVEWWSSIRKYKEHRLTFSTWDLIDLLSMFTSIKAERYISPKEISSTKNWLESSGLDKNTQKIIYNMHLNAPNSFKKAHKMEIIDDDILCEHHHIIITGIK